MCKAILIYVAAIKCPALNPVEPPLTSVLEGNFAGQSTFYFCPTGFRIQGPSNTTCLTSGKHQMRNLSNLVMKGIPLNSNIIRYVILNLI